MNAHPACVRAYYSLSPELSATDICVEQIMLRTWRPCISKLHDVERHVRGHPAWSESLNARTCFGGSCLSSQCINGIPAKYWPRRFYVVPVSNASFTHEFCAFLVCKTNVGSVIGKMAHSHAQRRNGVCVCCQAAILHQSPLSPS